jgi:hypothetical protein
MRRFYSGEWIIIPDFRQKKPLTRWQYGCAGY